MGERGFDPENKKQSLEHFPDLNRNGGPEEAFKMLTVLLTCPRAGIGPRTMNTNTVPEKYPWSENTPLPLLRVFVSSFPFPQ